MRSEPSASPFEIDDASALSLHKKQSSTYNKYACGCFLYAPSICSTYLSKRWQRCGHLLRRTAKNIGDKNSSLTESEAWQTDS